MIIDRPTLLYSWPVDNDAREEAERLAERSVWLSPEYLKAREEVLEFFCGEIGDEESFERHKAKSAAYNQQSILEERYLMQPAQFVIAAEHRAFIPIAESMRQHVNALLFESKTLSFTAQAMLTVSSKDGSDVDGRGISDICEGITLASRRLSMMACTAMVVSCAVGGEPRGAAYDYIICSKHGSDGYGKLSVFCDCMINDADVFEGFSLVFNDAGHLSIVCKEASDYLDMYLGHEFDAICSDIADDMMLKYSEGGITILNAGNIIEYVKLNADALELKI